ncbi:class I SAM-dependent DNA methyltransferase [Coleofasciculus sp.]|uniref:class I SAM-dependent DNA methyltransferase n=1 Tax=Coleofasciculus sp. TaxID=3100458 RepID=UPI0039F81552
MDSIKPYSDYDVLARIYQERWNQIYDDQVIQILENLFLQHLPNQAQILDLCCGNGNLIPPLLLKGYQVTGLDGSEAMLHYAREKAPESRLILGDARSFEFSPTFHGVISAGNSLNHVMNFDELKSVFNNVFVALLDNGLFAFNLSMEERYQSSQWNNIQRCGVNDDYIWIWQQIYDFDEKIGRRDITVMELKEEKWQRLDYQLLSKIYSNVDIESGLKQIGFTDIKFYDLCRYLELPDLLGEGVFVCRKPSG